MPKINWTTVESGPSREFSGNNNVIACLGWGSLIWDPGSLPIDGGWDEKGPCVPVEFVRKSQDGRLTLVIDEDAKPVQVLWCKMQNSLTLDEAVEELRVREGCCKKEHIGRWSREKPAPNSIPELKEWAQEKDIDAVIWTALPSNFNGKNGEKITADEAVEYLKDLPDCKREKAKKYVQCAPRQIETEYRKRFEDELGWKPIADCVGAG